MSLSHLMELVQNPTEKQNGAKERELQDDYLHLLLFLAGTTLLMTCLRHPFLASLIQQWRASVFLVLNLVLLAILFISTRVCSSQTKPQERGNNENVNLEGVKKRSKQCLQERGTNENVKLEEVKNTTKQGEGLRDCCELDDSEAKTDGSVPEPPRMSKEELNERAEAFIIMFRKHLVKDAKIAQTSFWHQRGANQKF